MLDKLFDLILRNLPIAIVIGIAVLRIIAARKKREQRAREEQARKGRAPEPAGSWSIEAELAKLRQEEKKDNDTKEEDDDEEEFSAWSLSVDAEDDTPRRPPGQKPARLEKPPAPAVRPPLWTEKPAVFSAVSPPVLPPVIPSVSSPVSPPPSWAAPIAARQGPAIAALPPLQQAVVMAEILGPPKGLS